jgi:hypothetical protein
MPNVAYELPIYVERMRAWEDIAHCCAGEYVIKRHRERYLPQLELTGDTKADALRYAAYLTRAVFYNVTQSTVEGLVGQVFTHDPVVEVPDEMDVIIDDAQGDGISLKQLAKIAVTELVKFARVGVFVDYPDVSATVSKAQQAAGFVRPTIIIYDPRHIINWRKVTIGAKRMLSLVVIRDSALVSDDGFEPTTETIYRVLRLDGAPATDETLSPDAPLRYVQELWREGAGAPYRTFEIVDGSGQPMREIPFMFSGAVTNDPEPDEPDLASLASLNLAHYRNSADYEDSCHLVGQPQPIYSGITDEWLTKIQGQVYFGSRAPVCLPVGGSAELLQVSPNGMLKESMDQKEAQMLAIGAKLITPQRVQRTATEAGIDDVKEMSTLGSIVDNLSQAITFALKICARFMNLPEDDINYQLNSDFDAAHMTPDERKQLLAEWVAGAITFSEMRAQLRKTGVATADDDEARTEIEADMPPAPDPALDPAVPPTQIAA